MTKQLSMRHNGSNWVHQDTEKLDFGVGAGWVPSAAPNQNWWVPGGCRVGAKV